MLPASADGFCWGLMKGEFKGYVSRQDPMYDFLWRVISDQFGIRQSRPAFRVFGLSSSNEVYRYDEKYSGARLICKFYGNRFGADRDKATNLAHQEYRSLETLRDYGLEGSPHHVIRPLAVERDINCVLALEYYDGEQFSYAIARAICQGHHAHLFWRLKSLAYYLATQHNRTANGVGVNFDSDTSYFGKLIRSLRKRHRIEQWDADELLLAESIAGETAPACGRTRRSGCTVTLHRPTSCSATGWMRPRSIWNE